MMVMMGRGQRVLVENKSQAKRRNRALCSSFPNNVGGGVRIHPENTRKSGRHGVQYVAQCVACAALRPVVWQ